MPKTILENILKDREEEQKKIQQVKKNAIQTESNMKKYISANESINDIDLQGQSMINEMSGETNQDMQNQSIDINATQDV